MNNAVTSYFEQLLQRIDTIYTSKSDPISKWVSNNLSYSFQNYEYQRQIMDDLHPDLTVIKCAQVGLTEVQLHKILAFARRNRRTASILTLPNEKMFRRVSQARLLPLIKNHKIFDSPIPQVRSMNLIEIGESWIYVTGCTEGDATSIAADALFHDEFDLSPQSIIGLFQSRLQNSRYRITQRFSTPSFIGYGVDKFWNSSDQHEYMIQCNHCNHWNIPTFTLDHVHVSSEAVPETGNLADVSDEFDMALRSSFVKCEKCNNRLDDAKNKEWVARFPERTHMRGYRIRPLSTTRIDPPYIFSQLFKYRAMNNLRGWYNTVLGEPYTDSNARISEFDILACCKHGPKSIPTDKPVHLGLDIGQVCHMVIGYFDPFPVITYMDTIRIDDLRSFIEKLIKDHPNLVAGVCDRYPYTPTVNELRELSNSKILPAEYRESADITKIIMDEFGNQDHLVLNRTKFLDEVAKHIRNHTITLSGFADQQNVIVTHLRDMVREETPDKPPRWLKLNGTDHYFHALAYLFASHTLDSIRTNGGDIETRFHYAILPVRFQELPKWQL